jgi:ABC-2 type transport system permease protein
MRAFATLLRRELSSYFISLTGYAIMAAVLLLVGASCVTMIEAVNNDDPIHVPLAELFFRTQFFWLVLLLATPVITMRLFALEKFSGTFETLMTAPVRDIEVVLAKYTAALAFYALVWLPPLGALQLVHHSTAPDLPFAWWPLASTFLGILTLGASFLAMGYLASSLTRSQIIAATLSFALGAALFLVSVLKFSVGIHAGRAAEVVNYISVFGQLEDFVRGVVDTKALVFHASLTVLCLFLTLKAVESRRWK